MDRAGINHKFMGEMPGTGFSLNLNLNPHGNEWFFGWGLGMMMMLGLHSMDDGIKRIEMKNQLYARYFHPLTQILVCLIQSAQVLFIKSVKVPLGKS